MTACTTPEYHKQHWLLETEIAHLSVVVTALDGEVELTGGCSTSILT